MNAFQWSLVADEMLTTIKLENTYANTHIAWLDKRDKRGCGRCFVYLAVIGHRKVHAIMQIHFAISLTSIKVKQQFHQIYGHQSRM